MHLIIHPKDDEGKIKIDVKGLDYQIFRGVSGSLYGDKDGSPSLKKELKEISFALNQIVGAIRNEY